MTHLQRDFRIPRRRALRALLTRRGLVLRLHIETDSDLIAAVVVDPSPRREPVWHDPEEVWGQEQ